MLSLGQISDNLKSVEWYQSGIKDLKLQIDNLPSDSPEKQDLTRHYSNALCALTELYMTDCCDDVDAEARCVEYMTLALQTDPTNPEVYSTNASVLLSQSRPQDARGQLEKGMDLWFVEAEADKPVILDPSWPSFDSRLALSKLLIEVSAFERALGIIETCQAENDEDGEVWYLFGWCYWSMSQEDGCRDEERNGLVMDAKECLERIVEVFEQF